jgi:hypothetical protein
LGCFLFEISSSWSHFCFISRVMIGCRDLSFSFIPSGISTP